MVRIDSTPALGKVRVFLSALKIRTFCTHVCSLRVVDHLAKRPSLGKTDSPKAISRKGEE